MPKYKPHKIADLFPMIEGGEFEALADDIAEYGLRESITLYEEKILDGRNRYKACLARGVEPKFKQYRGKDPLAFVVSLNLARRHLNESQRAMVAARMANMKHGQRADYADASIEASVVTQPEAAKRVNVSRATVQRAQKVLGSGDKEMIADVDAGKLPVSKAVHAIKMKDVDIVKKSEKASTVRAVVSKGDAVEWLSEQEDCDLLITDPPYMTDVDDIHDFANSWLPVALKKVKSTGRAYVCVGAYPDELYAYLGIEFEHMPISQVLVWTYRNTLGPTPKTGYKQNWQAILYYVGVDAPPLNCPKMTEQFSVQDINAPDGRLGDRLHAWQKPDELADRLIRHSTKPGDIVLDPFAGTGTFLVAAEHHGCVARGCEKAPKMLKILRERKIDVQ